MQAYRRLARGIAGIIFALVVACAVNPAEGNHYILPCTQNCGDGPGSLLGGAPSTQPWCPTCRLGLGQVYSNADGSVQFLQLLRFSPDESPPSLVGETLLAGDGVTENSFTFPDRQLEVAHLKVLVGTQGFADLNLVKPDFIVPNGFLPLRNGSVRLRNNDWLGGPVHWDALPTDGISALYPNIDGDPYARDLIDTAMAVNNAGQFYLFTPAAKFAGLWQSAPAGSEPGWGLAVDHQGDKIFAAWATYDHDGSPTWFAMLAQQWQVGKPQYADGMGSPNVFLGTAYRMQGPALGALTLDPGTVTAAPVSDVNLYFNLDEAVGGFVIGGSFAMSKALTPLTFAGPVPLCAEGAKPGPTPNYQGIWSNRNESDWAVHLTHQGDVVFVVWFTYDPSGKATWLTMTAAKTAPNNYGGSIYRTTGPSYDSGLYHSVPVTYTEVGTGNLAFADRDNGTFAYSVNGTSQIKDISRLAFADAPTVCN